MRTLTTAFIALVLWIAWLVASAKFGVSDAFGSGKISGGQQAVLLVTFLLALLLTIATVFMLLRLPFKIRKRRRQARASFADRNADPS